MTCVKAQSKQLLESAIADNTRYRNREEFGVTLTQEIHDYVCVHASMSYS